MNYHLFLWLFIENLLVSLFSRLYLLLPPTLSSSSLGVHGLNEEALHAAVRSSSLHQSSIIYVVGRLVDELVYIKILIYQNRQFQDLIRSQ